MAFMAKVIKAVAATVLLVLGSGCHTTHGASEGATPTHRWLATDSGATQARYTLHHSKCVEETGVNPQAIRRNDPAFERYEQCMTAKGYTLATY